MKGFPAHGPLLEGVVIENGRAIVTYKDTPLGLCPTSYNITGFEMAGADRKFHPAKARIVDKEAKLVVECEEVPEPIAVRYAFHSWYETNENSIRIFSFIIYTLCPGTRKHQI